MKEGYRPPSGSGSNEKAPNALVSDTLITYNGLQTQLALRDLKNTHPELDIDIEHPEDTTPEIRNQAMMEWVMNGSASNFREYFEEGNLNPEQVKDLQQVLKTVKERNTHH
jgi:hypothetical protein